MKKLTNKTEFRREIARLTRLVAAEEAATLEASEDSWVHGDREQQMDIIFGRRHAVDTMMHTLQRKSFSPSLKQELEDRSMCWIQGRGEREVGYRWRREAAKLVDSVIEKMHVPTEDVTNEL